MTFRGERPTYSLDLFEMGVRMATKKDYYEVLGVERQADDSALKSAYRKLVKEHHPDRNAGNAESERKFKGIEVV